MMRSTQRRTTRTLGLIVLDEGLLPTLSVWWVLKNKDGKKNCACSFETNTLTNKYKEEEYFSIQFFDCCPISIKQFPSSPSKWKTALNWGLLNTFPFKRALFYGLGQGFEIKDKQRSSILVAKFKFPPQETPLMEKRECFQSFFLHIIFCVTLCKSSSWKNRKMKALIPKNCFRFIQCTKKISFSPPSLVSVREKFMFLVGTDNLSTQRGMREKGKNQQILQTSSSSSWGFDQSLLLGVWIMFYIWSSSRNKKWTGRTLFMWLMALLFV